MKDYRCSFCGKRQDQVRTLIPGPAPVVFICDECVALCSDIIDENFAATPRPVPTRHLGGWLDRLRRMAIALPR